MAEVFKRLQYVNNVNDIATTQFADIISDFYDDVEIVTNTFSSGTGILEFKIPKFGNENFKIELNKKINGSAYIYNLNGSYNGVYVNQATFTTNTSSAGQINPKYVDMYLTNDGFCFVETTISGKPHAHIVLLSKGSDNKYYLSGLSSYTGTSTELQNVRTIELSDTSKEYTLLPLGDLKNYGLFKDGAIELHKIQIVDDTQTIVQDSNNQDVVLTNFFSTITDDIGVYTDIYIPNAGLVTGAVQYQKNTSWQSRNFMMTC